MDSNDIDIIMIAVLGLLVAAILIAAVITYPLFFVVVTLVYSAYLFNHFMPGAIQKFLGLDQAMIEKVLIIYFVFAAIFIFSSIKNEIEIAKCTTLDGETKIYKAEGFFEELMPVGTQCDYSVVSTKYFYDELLKQNSKNYDQKYKFC